MPLKNNPHQSFQWARQALERLSHDQLPPNPDYYAVYYYYFSGSNPRLKQAMDGLIGRQGKLTAADCAALYEEYLGSGTEQRMIKETSAAIEAEVGRVLDVIDKSATGASAYTRTLDSFSGQLSAAVPAEKLREAVARMAAETRAMAQQNERLSGQLSQATQQLSELRRNFEQAHKESQIDPLTEVGNRKFFDRELAQAMLEARDNATPLTLLMADIDHFKKFNDTYGHVIGDQVLRLVARTLVENLKGRDVIARYGGEEFVILLPLTRLTDAARVADLLRASLASKAIKKRDSSETLGTITISIGAAEYCPGEEGENFIARADAGLYKAKQAGRNRAMLETLTDEEKAVFAAKNRVW